jgi:hypothetical protein
MAEYISILCKCLSFIKLSKRYNLQDVVAYNSIFPAIVTFKMNKTTEQMHQFVFSFYKKINFLFLQWIILK